MPHFHFKPHTRPWMHNYHGTSSFVSASATYYSQVHSLGLEQELNLRRTIRISVHFAMNLSSVNHALSLFWNCPKQQRWCQSELLTFILILNACAIPFVLCTAIPAMVILLSELGNIFGTNSSNPDLVDSHYVTYVQLYTSMVKAMEQCVPLHVRPHLLTYLLGEGYISSRNKFREVWQEVDSKRSKLERLEVCHPNVPFDTRFEIVLTEDDRSFLDHIRHRGLARFTVVEINALHLLLMRT